MDYRETAKYPTSLRRLPLVAIGMVGIALVIIIFMEMQKTRKAAEADKFNTSASRFIQALSESIDQNLHTLVTMTAFYQASDKVTQNDFRHYTVPLLRHHPGIVSIAWLPRLRAQMLEEDAESVQLGYPFFTLKERPAVGKDAYPYLHLQGQNYLKGTDKWIGNLYKNLPESFSNGNLESAFLYSSNLTAKNSLVPGKYVFPVLIPYSNPYDEQGAKITATKPEISGIIAMNFLLEGLIKEASFHADYMPSRMVLHDINPQGILGTILEVRNGTEISELSSYTPPENKFFNELPVSVAGRKWNIVIEDSKNTSSLSLTYTDWGILFLLVTNTFLLMGYFYLLQRREDEVALQVKEKTRALSRSQEEQARLITVLSRSNAELERFAYIASHDLQEPLRVIGSFSTKMKRALEQPNPDCESMKSYAGFMYDASSRLHTLVRDLLAYARSSETERTVENVDLNEIMQLVRSHIAESIRESKAELHIGELGKVTCNRLGLIQVFQNLLLNAIKYREEGRPLVIHISAIREGNKLKVAVVDNGIGIPQKELVEIFLPFKRLQQKGKTEGTGIGLAICKQVVESCGGQISADSVVGKGSTFHVSLPAATS